MAVHGWGFTPEEVGQLSLGPSYSLALNFTYVMIECCMRALCASMFTWTWQHRIGVERQSVVALAIDISMHYWCEEKMATCVSYETETDNSSSEIAVIILIP